jgi:site-specific DNA-methyltransferase (adenine-specific)
VRAKQQELVFTGAPKKSRARGTSVTAKPTSAKLPGAKLPGAKLPSAKLRASAKLTAGEKTLGRVTILCEDNLAAITRMPSASINLIYIDPPFNTGHKQSRTRTKTTRDEAGDRTGFQGNRYKTTVLGKSSYRDSFGDDYLGFLEPRLREAHRLLTAEGSLFLHLDYREVHYAKVLLDSIFGRTSFINEIIWSYDYGARATNRWSPKHDNILWYAKDPKNYCFNYDAIDRIPYMAPGLVGPEKAARGKTPTDAWWHTIVSPNGKEKTGYPTQKPLGILRRIVNVHSRPGDQLLDFFAGSGSFGEAAAEAGRDVTLVDESLEAIAVMKGRLKRFAPAVTP